MVGMTDLQGCFILVNLVRTACCITMMCDGLVRLNQSDGFGKDCVLDHNGGHDGSVMSIRSGELGKDYVSDHNGGRDGLVYRLTVCWTL